MTTKEFRKEFKKLAKEKEMVYFEIVLDERSCEKGVSQHSEIGVITLEQSQKIKEILNENPS